VPRASDEVAAHIVRAFFEVGLKPGERLGTELELAERFGVSRVVVRDAVAALVARGLLAVRVGAGGGLRIAHSDPDRLLDAFSIQLSLMGLARDELFEAMRVLEPSTAALAAARASTEQIRVLRQLVDDSRKVLDQPAEFTRQGVCFHQALADACGNRALRASLGALRATQLEHLSAFTTPRIAERVIRIHAAIVDAIESHDADAARALMTQHLERIAAF
jgi:GntR family transcriptional regulator, transcriptional repressor for pyruvate dehydrogenase complex